MLTHQKEKRERASCDLQIIGSQNNKTKAATMKDLKNLISNYQPKSEYSKPVRNNSEAQSSAVKLWEVMSGIYTDKWIKKNGVTPSSIWITEISLLTNEQIKFGIMACRENIRQGDKWSPDLADFLSMIHKRDLADIDSAFDRMIKRESPMDNIEFNTRNECGFRCKRELPENAARKLFKDTYIKYQQKVRDGEFIADMNQLALPEQSQVTEIDKMVTERQGKQLTPIEKRMMKIKRNK